MNEKKVSIIVPIFNGEKYLQKCIDSIVNQTYKNIEIILVDDGSSDNSRKICDEYAEKDTRIKKVYQKNSGVSSARNRGIDIATGDYIEFVDVDDYLDYGMTENLVMAIEGNYQLIICGYKCVYPNDIFIESNTSGMEGEYSKSDFFDIFGRLYEQLFINAPWNKLYDNKIIKINSIYFDNNVSLGEDLLFNLNYLEYCGNIKIINDCSYNHVQLNFNSLTVRYKEDYFENQQLLFCKVIDFLKANQAYTDENKELVEVAYTTSIVVSFQNLYNGNLKKLDRKKKIQQIVFEPQVRNILGHLREGNAQKQLLGFLIGNNLINTIDFYFSTKLYLKRNMDPLFQLCKKINK